MLFEQIDFFRSSSSFLRVWHCVALHGVRTREVCVCVCVYVCVCGMHTSTYMHSLKIIPFTSLPPPPVADAHTHTHTHYIHTPQQAHTTITIPSHMEKAAPNWSNGNRPGRYRFQGLALHQMKAGETERDRNRDRDTERERRTDKERHRERRRPLLLL